MIQPKSSVKSGLASPPPFRKCESIVPRRQLPRRHNKSCKDFVIDHRLKDLRRRHSSVLVLAHVLPSPTGSQSNPGWSSMNIWSSKGIGKISWCFSNLVRKVSILSQVDFGCVALCRMNSVSGLIMAESSSGWGRARCHSLTNDI